MRAGGKGAGVMHLAFFTCDCFLALCQWECIVYIKIYFILFYF